MELEQDLDAVEAREEKWQMKFNLTKCRVLTITKKWKQIESNYTLHRQTLQRVSSVKYLGVEVTEHLHWGNTSTGETPPLGKHLHWGNTSTGETPPLGKHLHWGNTSTGETPPLGKHLHWGNISRLSRLKRTRPVISFIETWMGSQQPSQELDSPVEIVTVAWDTHQR